MNTQPHRNTCKSTLRAAVALAALAAGSALAGPVAYATLPVAGNIQRTAVATQTLTKGGSASPLLGRNGQIPALPPLLAQVAGASTFSNSSWDARFQPVLPRTLLAPVKPARQQIKDAKDTLHQTRASSVNRDTLVLPNRVPTAAAPGPVAPYKAAAHYR